MAATVVLLHQTADSAEHFDWLLQRPGGGPLITFRTAQRPDRPPPWHLTAERLPDHRDTYLTYQGPLSGARGHVTRVAEGECDVSVDRPGSIQAIVRFDGLSAELNGSRTGNSHWLLELRSIQPPSTP